MTCPIEHLLFGILDLFIKNKNAPCYARPIHGNSLKFETCSFFILLDVDNHILPSMSCMEKIMPVEIARRESTFYVKRSRVTWRVLNYDEQIAKTKLN